MISMVQAHPKREQWGKGESVFYWGDSAQRLEDTLQAYGGRVQLAYMDPPFMTGGTYRFIQRVGEAGWKGNPRYQVAHSTYHDQYRGGMEEYLAFLRPVVERSRALLTETGCIAVHVDWRTSAHIRLLLDEIFGREHFVNEIIWAYQSGGRSDRHFSRKHDSIFLYRKGAELAFYPEAVGVPRGRARRNHLKRSVDEDGRVYFSIRVSGKEYRYYEDDLIFPSDVWTDISPLQQKDPERTGYETQKPMALLERLIRALTLPGETVCDPFSGSGTTAEAAASLGRRALALDKDAFSLHLFRRRLLARGGSFRLANLPEAGEPAEDDQLVLEAEQGKVELMAWRVLGRGFSTPPSLLPHEDTLVDFWALGRRVGDTFYGGAYSMRGHHSPALENRLSMPEGEGTPCAMVVDVYGTTTYWDLL